MSSQINEPDEESKSEFNQPQEFDVSQQLQVWQNKHQLGISQILTHIENEVPREFLEEIERAEEKVEQMAKFEKEILDEVTQAEEKIRAIIERIDSNTCTGQNKDGILKQGKGSYAECIKIDINRM